MAVWSSVCACYEGSVWTAELGRVFREDTHKNMAILAASGESPWEEAVRQRGGVLWLAAAEGTVACLSSETPDYKL